MTSKYSDTFVKKIKDHKLKGGVLLQCFPGQGLVGRIAGMHLIDSFEVKESAKVYSSYFPHLVIFQGELGKLVHAELYAIENTNPPLLVLTGESQPQEGPDGMFRVLNATLDLAQEWGIETVIAIGGFRPSDLKTTPEITAFAFTEKDAQQIKDWDIKLFTEGRVSGAVGVITALAAERGMKSYGLMGKVHLKDAPSMAFGVDPNAAKNVLNAVMKMTGVELDLTKMDKMIKEIEQTEANAMKVIDDMGLQGGNKEDRKSFMI